MWKKHKAFILVICLLMTQVYTSVATSEDVDWKISDGLRGIVCIDNLFYTYYDDKMYTWSPNDMHPELYCSMPSPPPTWKDDWEGLSFDDLPVEARAAYCDAVTDLIAGEDALWAYNAYSGKIGTITERGVAWSDLKLDNSYAFTGESVFLRACPMQAFVEDGKLFMFMEKDSTHIPVDETTVLLCFDLTSGSYEMMETNNAIACCRYRPGSLLLLRRGSPSSQILSVMDITTGVIEDLYVPVPFQDGSLEALPSVAGLAYDAENDRIYLSAQSQVWEVGPDESLKAVAYIPSEIFYDMPAWFLADGRYAIYARSLYIRSVSVE